MQQLIRRLALTVALCAAPALAEDAPEAAPKAEATETKKIPELSAEAKTLLEKIETAYTKLKSLELSGNVVSDFDAAGQKQNQTQTFSATYSAPNLFRHVMKDDVQVGSTGEKQYIFVPARNIYLQSDAPKGKSAVKDYSDPVKQVMSMQNPSLALAVTSSPTAHVLDEASTISVGPDTKIGDTACPTLMVKGEEGVSVSLAFDPSTSLLRQASFDLSGMLTKRGAPDVKKAVITVSYDKTTSNADVKTETFAWAPPEGAKDMASARADDSPASGLEGKAAPDFKLAEVGGGNVSLADLKGSVVILDFWATWCGPCRASLPKLNKLYDEMKKDGLKVYAVNLEEDKETVQKFIKETKLTVPVLLDEKGAAGQAYHAQSIPETVLIGKDGKVKKVFVGFGPNSEEELKKAVEKALK